MSKGASFRKWSRIIHRDVSYLFAGMILIYALSGILMNHRGDLNPHYSVSRKECKIESGLDFSDKAKVDKAMVLKMLEPLGEADNYTKVGNTAEADNIMAQKALIESYLPQMLSEAEIRAIIETLEDKTVPSVMRHFKTNYNGKCEMKTVSDVLKNM